MKHIEKLAHDLMRQFELPQQYWEFQWNRSCRRIGECHYPWVDLSGTLRQIGKIKLSRPLCELNSIEEIEDTLRHEIAHALTGPLPGDVHGEAWLAMCLITGARPEPCGLGKRIVPAPWQGECPGCKVIHHRYKKPDQTMVYRCIHCQNFVEFNHRNYLEKNI